MKPLLTLGLFLFSCLLTTQSYAVSTSLRNQNYLAESFEIQANSITHLKLPLKSLKGSLLTNKEGIQISFKEKGSIKILTLDSQITQLDQKQLGDFPLYLMGFKKVDADSPKAAIIRERITNTQKIYEPIKMASFRTPNGDGYLLIGKKQSVIYLTDKRHKDVITKIHIETMSELDINNLIIKGLI